MKKFSWYFSLVSSMNMNTVAKAINYLKYKMSKPKPVTLVSGGTYVIVQLVTTNRCNLKCGYCVMSKFVDYDKELPSKEMDFEFIRKAFKNPLLNNALLVDFGGGEPLLVNDIEKSIAFLKSRGHLVNMATNGLLLKNRIHGLKKAGITRINVSLYPENIEFLKKALPEINSVFPVHTSFVLTKSQLEKKQSQIFDVTDMIRKSGCHGLRFYNYQPLGRNADKNEVVTDEITAYKEFRSRIERNFSDFVTWDTIITESPAGERKKRCRQLWGRVQILPDGAVKLCCGSDLCLPDDINILTST
ncbi:MAG: radical SAM protein, partial [Dysgonamonadaceae bacterium]|nr:radical SAM protein [Dysgonamonadaceae bacterium]